MSRLGQHIRVVQSKMALGTFLLALAWSLIVLCCAIGLSHIVQRAIAHYLPHTAAWYWTATALAAIFPMVYAVLRRPTPHEAAVAIDDRLGLKEKFSTALFIRASKDPFASAARRDAERTADKVSLAKRFPIEIPRASLGSVGAALALLPIFAWMPELDLFGAEKARVQVKKQEAAVQAAQRDVKRAITAIAEAPQEVAADEQIKLAAKELPEMFKKAGNDPTRIAKQAQETLKEIEAIKQKINESHEFAAARDEIDNFKNMSAPTPGETGPVADAHREIAEGKLQEAVNDLKKAVGNFDKMDQQEKEKTAEQMQKFAEEIRRQANDPNIQPQLPQQLQQAGMSQQQAQQQAQQMEPLMQQAANGNQQAQQQLQNMANQAVQQANAQQGGSNQQQQQRANQVQQAVAKAQQAANAQANAQAMQQAAQQLAQAMKQSAGQGSPSQPGKSGQSQRQQLAQAAAAMQQQLQQLQAQANGAAGIAAGQQNGAAGQGGQQDQNRQQGPGRQADGQWAQGDPRPVPAGGQGGPGIAQGGNRPNPTEAPFATKTEFSQSQTNDKGRILASSFVKAPAERGQSNMMLSKVAESEMKDATDEVQQDRIPRGSWKAVKGYFDTLKTDQTPAK